MILTGWRVGEARWGGYATRARVKADWLVRCPTGSRSRQAMAVGTAGLTAMLAILALEEHGLTPGQGQVLVTGAAGGVGSVAVALLAAAGHEVAAVTGRPETERYLRDLGATRDRPARGPGRRRSPSRSKPRPGPAASTPWAARCWRGSSGRCATAPRSRPSGLAGGAHVPRHRDPVPPARREPARHRLGPASIPAREAAWARLARDLPKDRLDAMIRPATLEDLPVLGRGDPEGRGPGPRRRGPVRLTTLAVVRARTNR